MSDDSLAGRERARPWCSLHLRGTWGPVEGFPLHLRALWGTWGQMEGGGWGGSETPPPNLVILSKIKFFFFF